MQAVIPKELFPNYNKAYFAGVYLCTWVQMSTGVDNFKYLFSRWQLNCRLLIPNFTQSRLFTLATCLCYPQQRFLHKLLISAESMCALSDKWELE